MSFTKKQIAKTANYIAEKLISSDEFSNRKWFCQQFKKVLAERSQAVILDFSNISHDFGQLRDAMQERGIQVPDGFQVLLFNNGKSTVSGQGGVQCTIFGAEEPAKERFDLQDLVLALKHVDEQYESSDEEGWEAEFRAPPPPMLNQFIPFNDSFAARSVEQDESSTLSPRQKIASI